MQAEPLSRRLRKVSLILPQRYDHGLIFRINSEMKGKWADLACTNEVSCLLPMTHSSGKLTLQHGSISVQQVFEIFGTQELTVSSVPPLSGKLTQIGSLL